MGREIERKFLPSGEGWREGITESRRMRQGYLHNSERCSVRVRSDGRRAAINVKSGTLGVERSEFDYPIPLAEAERLLEGLCLKPLIEKTRHYVPVGGHTWEIDVFEGENAGLVVAEIELAAPDEPFERPPWLGAEVSDDPRYYNVCLVTHPFNSW